MLKAGDLARREDCRVKGVKIGKTRRDRGISHVCPERRALFSRNLVCSIGDSSPIIVCSNDDPGVTLTYFTARSTLVT